MRLLFSVSLALFLSACTIGGGGPTEDAGRISPIVDGRFVCLYPEAVACIGNDHYSCEPDGEFLATVRVDCDDVMIGDPPRRAVCVDTIGCTVCRPDETFCDQGNVVQCNDEGDGFDLIEACDVDSGEVCQQGQCQNL